MVKGCPSFNIFRIQQRMEDVFEEQIEHLTGALFRNTPKGKKKIQLLVLHRLGHELAYNAGVLCGLDLPPPPHH